VVEEEEVWVGSSADRRLDCIAPVVQDIQVVCSSTWYCLEGWQAEEEVPCHADLVGREVTAEAEVLECLSSHCEHSEEEEEAVIAVLIDTLRRERSGRED